MNILFLCVANSARSQIAEGLARKLLPGHTIQSAGSQPASVNPYAVRVMKEIGVDMSAHRSKPVDSIDLGKVDLIVTLCAEEFCPTVSTRTRKLHWPTKDPAGVGDTDEARLEAFREARESIRGKLVELIEREGLRR